MWLCRFASALVLLPGLAGPALAWLPEGHLATGAIAYDGLATTDPDALPAIDRIMRSHPERAWFDRELGSLAGPARTRRLLELMAIWPDVARGGPFDHDGWHYDQAFVSPLRHLVPFAFGGATAAFRRTLRTVRDPGAPGAERALALCWVMHIVGDMHQPLHAALWIGWRFPVSDAGGNWAWVRRPEPGARPERLHFFWDAAGRPESPDDGALSRRSPDAWVAQLEAAHPFAAEPAVADPPDAFDRWAGESRLLAAAAVYEHGALPMGRSAEHPLLLESAYVARAQEAGAARIAAAGNRIGRLLTGVR